MTVKCVNDSCTQRKACKHWRVKDGTPLRFTSSDGFSPCVNFECHEHNFIHVHGQSERACSNCDLKEKQAHCIVEYSNNYDYVEWSFA